MTDTHRGHEIRTHCRCRMVGRTKTARAPPIRFAISNAGTATPDPIAAKALQSDRTARGTARGYEYYAITDVAPLLSMQRMTNAKALAQRKQIRELECAAGIRLLHGTELNIQPVGSLDGDDEFLSTFDIRGLGAFPVPPVAGRNDHPSIARRRTSVRRCDRPSHHPLIGTWTPSFA